MRKNAAYSGSGLSESRYRSIVWPIVILGVLFLVFTTFNSRPDPRSFSPEIHSTAALDPEKLGFDLDPESGSTETPDLGEGEGGDAAGDDAKEEEEDVAGVQQWEMCGRREGIGGADYIPCLDNLRAIKALKSKKHMEFRERHCPDPSPTCLVPLPPGYRQPVPWPKSRDNIWFDNVPHARLTELKREQNWVRKEGDYLVFPGGGTQFKDGVMHYIEFIEETYPEVAWGKRTRVVLDVGCGVASFGGYLLDKNVITMSLAPRDIHEAQIQFALERGIPAIISIIATKKLTFPDNVYDMVHCARCRIRWHEEGGKALLEINRVLRPGGFFAWSATPIYRDDAEDKALWEGMISFTESICWKMVAKKVDANGIGLAIFQKPNSNSCYKNREVESPPLCDESSRQKIAWYVPLEDCLPLLPETEESTETAWPGEWPERLNKEPSNLPTEESFEDNTRQWNDLVTGTYIDELGIDWSIVRNVMDMNAGLGGFAAATVDRPLWVMNTVPPSAPDTLPAVFDRGFIGIYHDWCESFNTYPRTYDLLHSSYLFESLSQRCSVRSVVAEMDRILRPGGWALVRDSLAMIEKVESLFKSLHWETTTFADKQIIVGKKSFWRPADER